MEAHGKRPTIIGGPAHMENHRSSIACPASTYHTLDRTWATNANSAGIGRQTQRSDAKMAPATQRWMEEWTREQPWNIIGSFATVSSPKELHRVGGETGSNSAVAETDEQEESKVTGPHDIEYTWSSS